MVLICLLFQCVVLSVANFFLFNRQLAPNNLAKTFCFVITSFVTVRLITETLGTLFSTWGTLFSLVQRRLKSATE